MRNSVADLASIATIHLDRSRTPRAFDLNESLWKKELEHMFELVQHHLDALREVHNEPLDKQPCLSIAIFGTYGSGKTSLLKTFARLTNSGGLAKRVEGGVLDLPKPNLLDARIYALPEIQPNLMAKDDHFLYAFLAAALEEDLHPRTLKRLRGSRRSRAASGAEAEEWSRDQQPENAQFLSPVQRAFQEVSEYLQVVDPNRAAEEYDPLGVSLERLERHTSGLRLKESLANLIVQLAERLAGPAPSLLLLPVDDADMAQENLVETLDSYRRYLTHPRLVPVFTFTDRLAEELLQVHFARKLSLAESAEISRERDETSGVSNLTQNLGLQYLVKLFPVRNRIRLGPAASRVQATRFKTADGGNNFAVDLLRAASVLLFGCPEWPVVPEVRAALRPSTLRRQIQVVDAMYEARVEDLWDFADSGEEDGAPLPIPIGRWREAFDDACWAVLNAHRDALAEFDLHLEDLQSWSPLGLRRALLGTILSRPTVQRRQLLKSWRYRSEDRRNQLLSLLALNAFRPRMSGEEPGGDDPREWLVFQREASGGAAGGSKPSERRGIDLMLGVIWFLELWLGFYLPQILARREETALGDGSGRAAAGPFELDPGAGPFLSRSMIGVGWSLGSGPSHAVQGFFRLRKPSGTGMLSLDPVGFADLLRKTRAEASKPQPEAEAAGLLEQLNLLLHLWCFYGDGPRESWAALSLWKGLGVLGRLLQEFLFCRSQEKAGEPCFVGRAQRILENAYRAAREPGALGMDAASSFVRRDPEEPSLKAEIEVLAEDLETWLESYSGLRIGPTPPAVIRDGKHLEEAWKGCFLRRLHGDQLLGELWRDLGAAYLEPPSEEAKAPLWSKLRFGHADEEFSAARGSWDASTAMEKWEDVLERYFAHTVLRSRDGRQDETGRDLASFFRDCPLIKRWKDLEPEIDSLELVVEKAPMAAEGEAGARAEKQDDGTAEPEPAP